MMNEGCVGCPPGKLRFKHQSSFTRVRTSIDVSAGTLQMAELLSVSKRALNRALGSMIQEYRRHDKKPYKE